MMGARVGMAKTPFEYWTAVNRAPVTKKTCAGSTIRVNRTVLATCSAENPG